METLKATLSYDGITGLIKELERYAESLDDKNKMFIDLLLDCGIRVAEQKISGGTHSMPERITFYKDYADAEDHGVTGLMVGVGETFFSHWYEEDGTEHNDEVYPLAMMEFGSAGLAVPYTSAYGGFGGKGSFAIKGHENDYSWWIITDYDEDTQQPTARKLGTAVAPTQPMYNAMLEMQTQIRECARKAFGGEI